MNELYRRYREQGVFRKEQVIADFPHLNQNAVNKKIEEAKRVSKVVKSINGRRGIYFIVEPDQNYAGAQADVLKVAANIARGAIICYAGALSLYGKSHSIHNIIYISSKRRFRDLLYKGIQYRYVTLPHRDRFIEQLFYKGITIKTTSLERTLVDCLRNMKYAGGFEQLYKSFEGVHYINWKKLDKCLGCFSSPLLNARVGLFCTFFAEKWGLDEQFFKRLEKKVPKAADYFLGRETQGGELVHRWNLIVPKEVMMIGGLYDN